MVGIRDVRRRGARPLVVPRRPRRRDRGGHRSAPLPDRPRAGRADGVGAARRVDDRHALPRRLRDRQPRTRRPHGADVHRPGRVTGSRHPHRAVARRGTDRAGAGRDVAGDRDARPHPRPPRLPRSSTTAAPVALFTGGSLMVGTVGRTDLCGPELAEPLAHEMFHSLRRLDELARRPRRLPDPRRRLVLLRARRRRAHDHARPRAGHQPTVPHRRRGQLRRAAARRVRVRSPPTSPGCPSSTGAAHAATRSCPALDRLDVDAVERHVAAGARDRRRPTDRRVRRRAHPRLAVERAAAGVRQLARLARRPRPAARVRRSTTTRTATSSSANASTSATNSSSASSTAASTPGAQRARRSPASPLVDPAAHASAR